MAGTIFTEFQRVNTAIVSRSAPRNGVPCNAMKPLFTKIICTDWPALFCFIAIPMIWLIGMAFPYIRPSAHFDRIQLLSIALPITLVAFGFLVWRVVRIRRLFRLGQTIEATITRVRLVRDRGRVEFAYDLAGSQYSSWTPVHKNTAVLSLFEGQRVQGLIDPSQPTLAIIQHLYC
jgi:hypothetical protein